MKIIRERRPELADTALVLVSTPDFSGGLQEGWGKAVAAMVEQLVPPCPLGGRDPDLVSVLAPSHFTPGDVEELRDIVEAFGLRAIMLPDHSTSLDGHVPERWIGATLGGATLDEIRSMGRSSLIVTVGEHMRWAAEALHKKSAAPYLLFPSLSGLQASDALIAALAKASGRPVPARLRRQRSRLIDAMLDGHFTFNGVRAAVAAEPDHLLALCVWLAEMGVEIAAAISTVHLPMLAGVPTEDVVVGDLGDLEARAEGCDLLLTHAHGRQASERLGIPLFRAGFPIFDRLGAAHQVSIGYRGTSRLIFDVANLLLERHEADPHCGATRHDNAAFTAH